MAWLIGIATGVVAGIVSSVIFFIGIGCIKPKINISDNICFTPDSTDSSKGVYRIKVVNKSKVMLTNLKYILLYVKNKGNEVFSVEEIPTVKNTLQFIDKYKRSEDYSDYAVRIAFKYDKNKYPLNDSAKLNFIIFAEHSYSNKSKCYKKIYCADNIKTGIYQIGKSTKIVN